MTMRRITFDLLPALLASLLIVGCGSALNIPKPHTGAPIPMPAVEPSVIQIPITIGLGPMFVEIEKGVPRAQRASKDWTVVGSNAVGDIGVKYEVWRDPLQLSVTANTLHVGGRVHYWFQFAQEVPKPIIGGSFWQSLGSCGVGEPPREAIVGMETRVAWTDAWRLTSTTSIAPTTFPNKCEVTFLKYNVTDRVEQAFVAGLKQGAVLADARIKQVGDVRSIGEAAWKQLQEPIELDSGLWLVIEPTAASAAPLSGSGRDVTATIGLTAMPHVVVGAKPERSSRPLPKLAAAAAGNGFHVAVEGEISFAEASRQLAHALVGQSYTKLGHTATVTAASIYGAGEQAVVVLDLTGDVKGTVYLVGRPTYDPKVNVFYVRDLDYSLETAQTLANVADWLFHGAFRSSVAEQTRWPLNDHIAGVKVRLEKALNRRLAPNVVAHGTVASLRPIGVYITSDSFKARVAIDGAVSMTVEF
jgi:hypothetical protein